jgi:hypothetical protein
MYLLLSPARLGFSPLVRKTRRMEDGAYSLLGLFGVSMPLIYGEGAFHPPFTAAIKVWMKRGKPGKPRVHVSKSSRPHNLQAYITPTEFLSLVIFYNK